MAKSVETPVYVKANPYNETTPILAFRWLNVHRADSTQALKILSPRQKKMVMGI